MHKLKINVGGLYCSGCAQEIACLLRDKFKITKLSTNLNTKVLEFSVDSESEGRDIVRELERKGHGPIKIL